MARKYEQKKRAEKQEETRRRITEAAVELHELVGPAHATISAIARKAGVQRLTVYRHFSDERALFLACTAHYQAENPLPDPAPWAEIPDPEARLRRGLAEVYAYYRRVEPMMASSIRDMPLKPILFEVLAPLFEHWGRMGEILAAGWEVSGEQRGQLHAAIGHALDFGTWHSLVRRQGLADEQAIELMVCMVRCSVCSNSA